MTGPFDLPLLRRLEAYIELVAALPPIPDRWEVAPDVWHTWKAGGPFPDEVIEIVRRSAGAPPGLAPPIVVRWPMAPGSWVAYDSDGDEMARGGPGS